MRDGMTLWKERAHTYWSEAIRYLRLIGNSGFLFTLYLLVIIGSYYYSVLLKWLPDTFPAIIIFIAVFAHFLTRGNVRTFVKQADVVFLLPFEEKLDKYFIASKWYSFAIQSAIVSIILVIFSPLYMKYLAEDAGSIWLILILLLMIKGWNVMTNWEEQRLQSEQERLLHFLGRGVLNAVLLFFIFAGANISYVLAVFAIMIALYFLYYRKLASERSLKWDHLIQVEEKMLLFFYRIANAFTDVPQLRHQVHERNYLRWLLPVLTNSKASVYHYLFARSFLRANDYAGIYVRLTLIAAVVLAFLPSGWLQLAVFILFMHMTATQLSTLSFHYDTSIWVDLYPTESHIKKVALTQLGFRLLLIMTAIEVIILFLTSTYVIAIGALMIGFLYSYIGSQKFIYKTKKR